MLATHFSFSLHTHSHLSHFFFLLRSWEFCFIVNVVRMARRVERIEDKRFSDHVQEMLNFHGLDAEKVRRILSFSVSSSICSS